MRIWHEEIFGPVSAVRTFSNEEEALALANDTSYGLAAYVYGSNQGQCDRIAKHLEAGMVCINDCVLAGAQIPFCGVKQSGYGVEGGTDAIYQYLQSKYLSLGSAPATQL